MACWAGDSWLFTSPPPGLGTLEQGTRMQQSGRQWLEKLPPDSHTHVN